MHIEISPRQTGKSLRLIKLASDRLLEDAITIRGGQVYYVSPSMRMSDSLRKMGQRYLPSGRADAIRFMGIDSFENTLHGISENSSVFFDEIDLLPEKWHCDPFWLIRILEQGIYFATATTLKHLHNNFDIQMFLSGENPDVLLTALQKNNWRYIKTDTNYITKDSNYLEKIIVDQEGLLTKKAVAQINITIDVECPHCEEHLDLMQIPHLTEEGAIHVAALSGEVFGCKDFGEVIECAECGKEYRVDEILW